MAVKFFDQKATGTMGQPDFVPSKQGLFSALGGILSNVAVGLQNPTALAELQQRNAEAEQNFQKYLAEMKLKQEDNQKNSLDNQIATFQKFKAMQEMNPSLKDASISTSKQGVTLKTPMSLNKLNEQDAVTLGQQLVDGQLVPNQLTRTQRTQAILSAQKLDPSYSPAKADIEFQVNKTGAAQFEKNFNNLDSFHRDFEKNSDYLLNLSKDYDRSKIPLINQAIVRGDNSIKGDPKATQLLQAVNTVGNGYARLQNPTLSGQALSDAARHEAQAIINAFQSDEQLRGLLDKKSGSMRIDAQNRIDAAQEVRQEIKQRYGGTSEKLITDKQKQALEILRKRGVIK